jgi:hypothetical protein
MSDIKSFLEFKKLYEEWNYVDSSMIDAIDYDDDDEVLMVRFAGGEEYEYYNVEQEIYDELLRADSKGQFFWQNIRDYYSYSKTN